MERKCVFCFTLIEECMGGVVAGDFLKLVAGLITPTEVREVCGKCALVRNPEELEQSTHHE